MFPPFAEPVLNASMPLPPLAPELGVEILIAPLLVCVPSPLLIETDPPVAIVLRPDTIPNPPPTPLVPLPTATQTQPPRPAVPAPDPTSTAPLLPVFDVPLLNTSRPLAPAVPTFAVATTTAPLLFAEPSPSTPTSDPAELHRSNLAKIADAAPADKKRD